LDTTGTSQAEFLRMFRSHTGIDMAHSQLSMLLRGSKRCSVTRAIEISEITGVAVEKLVAWPRERTHRISEQAVENQVAK
jgi:hypothetical protein